MMRLAQRRILLGVSGGIAAYKAPELVRRLREAGADVCVIVTEAAARFVSPLALEVVSGHPVGTSLWRTDRDGAGGDSTIVHTDVGQAVDLIMLAPATADLIAKVRHGLADDLLTTAVMACDTPTLVCPSMNTDMLDNPIVAANLAALRDPALNGRYTVLEPGVGLLACGVTGRGRLPDPPILIGAAASALTPDDLAGLRVAVSAGPTREPLDPVRFLTNRSTGTMGVAVARAFADRGADVTLIAGPIAAETPVGVARRVDVTSAAELADAVDRVWPEVDVLVMAAAVADFRPRSAAATKIKKDEGASETLALERTTDVLAAAAAKPDRPRVRLIGFAAETDDVEARARAKLARKDLDWIVANDVSAAGVGFGPGDNAGVLLGRAGERHPLERADKDTLATRLVDLLAEDLRERRADG